MTQDERRQREIEEGERWLSEVCHDPALPDLDRIKFRVRISAQEEWLRGKLTDEAPADLADRTKRRIWAVLAADRLGGLVSPGPAGARSASSIRLYRWAAGVAVVAAACLIALIGFYQRAPAEDELPFVTAFEGYVEDDLAVSLAELDDNLEELELAYGELMTDETDEIILDNLRDTIDNLLLSADRDEDWL